MAAGNSINQNSAGITGFTGTAFTGTAVTNHAVIVGGSTSSTLTNVGPSATAGQVLQSGGASADPAYSTATYPTTATSTGTILRADGTNWSATTATYPNTTTANQLLYSSATNTIGGLTSANNSIVLTDGSGVPSLATSLSNDFTFTKATSGATTTLTVSNTSNTASSSANILAQVAGGTAADATHQATISAGQAWTWGLDNSDSDAFVIASSSTLGTTNVMRVATTGEINYPLQSAFLAFLSSTALNKTGNSSVYTIGTDALTEVFDQNSDFNTNGTFTAPVTGRYQLSLGAGLTGCTINQAIVITMITSNRNYTTVVARPANTNDNYATMSFLCDMDAADTYTATVLGTGESGATDDVVGAAGVVHTGMSGYLAC